MFGTVFADFKKVHVLDKTDPEILDKKLNILRLHCWSQ